MCGCIQALKHFAEILVSHSLTHGIRVRNTLLVDVLIDTFVSSHLFGYIYEYHWWKLMVNTSYMNIVRNVNCRNVFPISYRVQCGKNWCTIQSFISCHVYSFVMIIMCIILLFSFAVCFFDFFLNSVFGFIENDLVSRQFGKVEI